MTEEVNTPRLVIAGVGSKSGKTTVALGFTEVLKRRGKQVQTFKVGSDFTDPSYLAHVSRRPCRALDSWMLGAEATTQAFTHSVADADCAVIEGNMGIFDGSGAAGDHPFPDSTADVARLINAPVVLVINIANMSETAAAVALGIKQLDPSLRVVGVILNRTPDDARCRAIEDAVWNMATLPVLGCLPDLHSASIPELGDGLLPISQNSDVDAAIMQMADMIQKFANVDLMERLMRGGAPLRLKSRPVVPRAESDRPVRIGVAFDDAFCSYFAENLEILEQAGAEIVPFSPLEDHSFERDVDAIYMGGTICDNFISRLASNHTLLAILKRLHASGVPIYAEGGGMFMCARAVVTADGSRYAMADIVPVELEIKPGLHRSGYRDLQVMSSNLMGSAGTRLRGIELHNTRTLAGGESLNPAYSMHTVSGEPLGCEGWATNNLTASLVQIHFAQDPGIAARLVDRARIHSAQTHLAIA